MTTPTSFYELTPDHVLDAVEKAGFLPTGRYLQLNSYENRVFDVWLETQERLIAKFYRPQRWSLEAILEEHSFLQELRDADIPAVAPLLQKSTKNPQLRTLSEHHHLWVGLFPRAIGRMPDELLPKDLVSIGRLVARIHNVGSKKIAKSRPTLSAKTYGWTSLELLRQWVAPEVWPRYESAATEILNILESELSQSSFLRIHGDCHKGNLLLSDKANAASEYFIVDFDDFCNGPAVQDIWMLLSGDPDSEDEELSAFLEGYESLREFNDEELSLMLPLRGLRIIHYAAWIAKRWTDPSFPRIFPQFQDYTYWAEETESLERIAWSL